MSTANKLTYLNETKGKIKDTINLTGANILSEDTFRSYAEKLKLGLIDIINNGTSDLYDSFPKTTQTGTEITLNDTYEAPMEIGLNGNTEQDGEPTPDVPVDVKVVTGDNTINVHGKNLFDSSLITGTTSSIKYIPIQCKANTDYTLSTNNVASPTNTNLFLSTTNSGVSSANNGAYLNSPRTINSGNNTTIYVGYRNDISNSWVQLEENPTATEYQPYQSKDYEINLGDIELCKIPNTNYQDIIFHAINGDSFYDTLDNATKQTLTYGKWYKHSEIGKVVLDGSENWQVLANVTLHSYYVDNFANALSTTNTKNYYSNYFVAIKTDDRYIDKTFFINAFSRIIITYDSISTLASFKSWLNTHNTIVYYVLTTPTNTEITDTTLINQLEELEKAKSVDDKTFISQINEQLPFILDLSALSKN